MAKTTKKAAEKANADAAAKKVTKKKVAKKAAVKKATTKKAVAKKAPAKKAATKKAPAMRAATTAATSRTVSPAQRHQLIAEAAYLRSEAQGFMGDPCQDWIDAEAEVEARLAKAGIRVEA